MAKFMASMFVAAAVWLMVVLIATVRGADSTSGCLPGIGCTRLVTTKYLERKLPDLDDEGLHELGRRYAKKLNKKSDSMSYDKVNSTLMKLHDWDRQRDSFDLSKIGLSDSWRGLLRLRDSVDQCSLNIADVSRYATSDKENECQQRFALECLRDHLEKCGFEERFSKIIDSIKQKSHARQDSYPFTTFYSYLEAQFWSQKSEKYDKQKINSDLKLLLSAIKELPTPGNISKESDCPEEMTINLLYWRANIEKCQNLFEDYFALYLDACGYEEQFKKVVNSISEATEKLRFSATFPSLHSYFRVEFFTKKLITRSSIREELVELFSAIVDFTNKADCTEESTNKLIQSTAESGHPSGKLKRIYFAQYLESCGFEQTFKRMIEHSKHTLDESWDSVKYPTLYRLCRRKSWKQPQIKQALSYIEYFSTLENISDEKDCTEEIKFNLVYRLAASDKDPELKELTKISFALYLDKCGFERKFQKAIDYSKQTSGISWDSVGYPTFYTFLMQGPQEQPKLMQALSTIEDLSAVENISHETDCTEELKSNLIDRQVESDNYPELQELVRVYFSLYLDKCGFEKKFTTVKAQHKILANENNLSSYLLRNLHPDTSKKPTTDLLTVLTAVSKLADFGQLDASNCKDETIDSIIELKSNYKLAADSTLERDLDAVFSDYFKACPDRFNMMAEKFKCDNKEGWTFIEKAVDLFESKLTYEFKVNPAIEWVLKIIPSAAVEIDGGKWTGTRDNQKTNDFNAKLEASCQTLLDYMDRDLTIMSNAPSLVKQDKQVMDFMKYLSCCSRVIIRPDFQPSPFKSMFQEIGMPFQPKQIAEGVHIWFQTPIVSSNTVSPNADQSTKKKAEEEELRRGLRIANAVALF